MFSYGMKSFQTFIWCSRFPKGHSLLKWSSFALYLEVWMKASPWTCVKGIHPFLATTREVPGFLLFSYTQGVLAKWHHVAWRRTHRLVQGIAMPFLCVLLDLQALTAVTVFTDFRDCSEWTAWCFCTPQHHCFQLSSTTADLPLRSYSALGSQLTVVLYGQTRT